MITRAQQAAWKIAVEMSPGRDAREAAAAGYRHGVTDALAVLRAQHAVRVHGGHLSGETVGVLNRAIQTIQALPDEEVTL